MTDLSVSRPDDEVLARFVRDYEAASEPATVEADYVGRYPALADEIRTLAVMNRQLHRAASLAPDLSQQLEPGRSVGPFQIERLLASGGMGEIYEARQAVLRRRVAIKVIRRGRDAAEARARFEREQRVLARLHQTHIIPVYAAGEDGDLLYFAMPFVDGATLQHVVEALRNQPSNRSGSTPPLAEVVGSLAGPAYPPNQPASTITIEGPSTKPRIIPANPDRRLLSVAYFRSIATALAEAAEALDHAHQARVCHRDVKPANLMIDRAGHCWIIDFGLAGFLDTSPNVSAAESVGDGHEKHMTHGPMGTPAYMAPEQYLSGKSDPRSDVWALGATLYELLTLRRAFDGPTAAAIREQVLKEEPNPANGLVRNPPAT